jgi:Flp pilus assembly protein TadG
MSPARTRLRGLAGDTSGATAVEFAMVGLFFFAFIYGMVGLAIQFLNTTSMDYAIYKASRDFQIGAVQSAGDTQAQFGTNYLTPSLQSVALLPSDATYSMIALTPSNPTPGITQTPVMNPDGSNKKDANGNNIYITTPSPIPANNFCLPKQGQILYIQASYSQAHVPSLDLGFGSLISPIGSGATIIVEPYPGAQPAGC